MKLSITTHEFPLIGKFTISRGSKLSVHVLTVKISDNGFSGWGECVPYERYGETIKSVINQIKNLQLPIDRDQLQKIMKPGAARNALDCALWDLEAKSKGKRVWEIAGMTKPNKLITAFTISLDKPQKMRAQAKKNSKRPLLKIKMGGENDLECIEAVTLGAPNSKIIVDANEAWDETEFQKLMPHLKRLGIKLVEQPFPTNNDDVLRNIEKPIPICADESCHDSLGLKSLVGKYDYVNIKLDKTGGLTEAVRLKNLAEKYKLKIMVGCMVGSSLGMAPAILLAQNVSFVDLDGPLLLKTDRNHRLKYDHDYVYPPTPNLWG